MGIESRQLYGVGYGLGLIGSLAAVPGLLLVGSVVSDGIALATTFSFAFGLVSVFRREDFDRDHSLAYRVGNWVGAVFVVALGLLMLAVGIVSLSAFG